jgi:hypothetical protein
LPPSDDPPQLDVEIGTNPNASVVYGGNRAGLFVALALVR